MAFVPLLQRLQATVTPASPALPFPVERLPDDVLALVLRALAQDSFRCAALVSKRWLRLAAAALSHLTVQHRGFKSNHIIEIHNPEHNRNKQLAWLPLPQLLSALGRFPTLTHVSLGAFSILSADGDAIFQCLAATCPGLTHLTVEHQFRMTVTVTGLSSLFRGCRKLREFRLLTTYALPHLPASLSLLTDLHTLHVCSDPHYGEDSLQKLVSAPESIIGALQQLRELRICAGANFQGLSECVGSLSNLRSLSVSNCFSEAVKKLPDAIGELGLLETLEIELDGLECIPESFQLLTGLKTFSLRSESLQHLPENVVASMTQLQTLSLTFCNSLTALPDAICFLPLSSLSISSCTSLDSLPQDIGALSHLRTLILFHLPNIWSLPESLGNLPRLKTLKLELPELQHLPKGFCEGSLRHCLEELKLYRCEQLRELPPFLYTLTRLEKLCIASCSLIESLEPLTPASPPDSSGPEPESYGFMERVVIAALFTAAVFTSMILLSVSLLAMERLIVPPSSGLDFIPPVLLVPAAMLTFRKSSNAAVTVVSLLVAVVVLLIAVLPRAWLLPAMLLTAALLVAAFLSSGKVNTAADTDTAAATVSAHPPAFVSIPVSDSATNSTDSHPGLVSLTELKVSNCPLISSLPKNFSFPALHMLTLRSLGDLSNDLDSPRWRLPNMQYMELDNVRGTGDAGSWLIRCLASYRAGRQQLLLHEEILFVLVQGFDLLLQAAWCLVVGPFYAPLRGACTWVTCTVCRLYRLSRLLCRSSCRKLQ
ncbi:hypothetical protein CLOM_g9153 [Closterium sp. NIES-68]|nr:hypothetical protein CLOM_g9153 [Closterium sp. NIES-68]GJP62140.1 hypothetical protein CLOP_g19233 [Closterium sp. NIES-67]